MSTNMETKEETMRSNHQLHINIYVMQTLFGHTYLLKASRLAQQIIYRHHELISSLHERLGFAQIWHLAINFSGDLDKHCI